MTTEDRGRNEMTRLQFEKSKAFGRRIEQLIPGGSHTYSRGRDRFPAESPNGIVRGKGPRIWDADGNCLVDWAMGLTAVSLGHADDAVDRAVCAAIKDGVIFQRSSQLELVAAEAFLSLTGTDMVKFARHGSAVTTAAVKLARGFTRRAGVAVPKEHPFFSYDDWFIGTTACDFGIPDEAKLHTWQFSYGDVASLHDVFRAHPGEIACVIMEPVKFEPPPDGYLQEVRALCHREGALFILDEMVTGLKLGVPGAAATLKAEADLYTYGKGIANGYANAALTGRGDVMSIGGLEPAGAPKLFLLSTTHGGESVGLAATIATLQRFADGMIVRQTAQTGELLRDRLQSVIRRHGLDAHLRIYGYPALMALEVRGPDGRPNAAFQTLFLQEVIAHGVLLQGIFVPTPSHGEAEIAATEQAFDAACPVLAQALAQNTTDGLLIGPPMRPVFRKHL
ncbi:glutamate-1-semialdehyde 2,1-aminomutase [Ferrovibrio sp.]|uniref:glutamate-1-semialdehyde 2,1-aminomutase n=1 Tax=Ferrovibrio sp. TaxID=1917215 RepID=UPI0025C46EE5|nr:glutamate-1-semialdehyde 2,1-aminomutase [Ferrovibrio sp.]